MSWELTPPPSSSLGDGEVNVTSQLLAGKRICLLICGSIAAYKAPDIIRELRRHSAIVQPVVSKSALQFVTEAALEWTSGQKVITSLTANAEHLGGDRQYDICLIAPASYNSINKIAQGIADTPATIVASSIIGLMEANKCKLFICPCMHGSMHNSLLTDSMQKLRTLGASIIKPRQEDGKNKLPEPSVIVDEVLKAACN